MSAFLLNAWYVGAWSEELGTGRPLARTLLETPIVLFRQNDGTPVALHDRCPHRFAPLSRGRIREDVIECGYHGLSFDRTGACVGNPHANAVPAAARVRSFPVIDRYSAVWIWMGEPQEADPGLIPDFAFLDDRITRRAVRGLTHVAASYWLEIDNLMDLSHIDYVHNGSIGSGAMYGGKHKVIQEGNTVRSNWWCPNVPCLPNFEPEIHANGRPTDHWLEMRWDPPGIMKLEVGVTLAGRPRSEGLAIPQGHFLTPETRASTHYFWTISRTNQLDSPEYDQILLNVTRRAFEGEDKPMLEAIQREMASGDLWAQQPVLLNVDKGAVQARRVLDKLLAEQDPPEQRSLEELGKVAQTAS